MENLCSGCKTPCCYNFRIGLELINPSSLKDLLAKHPYIHRVSSDLVLKHGHETIVGVYQCDRFNVSTGECADYETQPRPPFCHDTGTKIPPFGTICLLFPN